MKDKIKLAIGVPLATDWIPAPFWFSYENLKKPKDYILITFSGALTPFSRERIVLKALAENCTHLLFVDNDMVATPDAITKLLKHKKDIIAGLFFQRYEPYAPALSINDEHPIPKELTKVDWVGLAFTLINIEVFKNMPRPWFELDFNPKHIVGEDVLFFIKARKLGYDVWVEPKVDIGHLVTLSIRRNQDNMLKIKR